MYSRTTSSSRPTVDTKNPRAQKCWPTKFRFRSPYTRARWIALLPLMYPITCDTAYLGGIAIIMCTWSGSRCPSSIRLSFCSASRRKISPKYRHNPAYSALRRHLGMNTTWYLHSHFVWFRLSYSSIADLLFVCFSGSRSGVSAMDSSKCQTLTATPAEPGELPTELGCRGRQRARRPRRAVQLYAFARITLCLPVPRKMVAVLRHQQVRRQRLTHGPSVIRSARRSPRRWRSIRLCCLRRFQFVQPQLQLLDLPLQLLRLPPKLHPSQLRDQQLQALALGLARSPRFVFRVKFFLLRGERPVLREQDSCQAFAL